MLAETVYRFLGDPAPVAEANGVFLPRPHDESGVQNIPHSGKMHAWE
jgi:hypothetical protein